jgi:molybdopterin molybdotransferase
VPDGADTVVIQEDAERSGAQVVVRAAPASGANIRKAGSDFREGEMLLGPGRMLDPGVLTLAAAAGHATLSVRRRPVVAILATGDELVEPGSRVGPDQIVSSNPYGLAAVVERAGGAPRLIGIAADTRAAIDAGVAAAAGADVLVTIGGASVGERDLVRPALEARGLSLDFWKIAMRPGKPMLFGRLGPLRVLGVPGNPLSCLITARIFLVPLIHRLLGCTDSPAAVGRAVLTRGLDANGPRQHYMLATLEPDSADRPRVTALPSQDSARLSGFIAANALIVRAPHAPASPAGDTVAVLPLAL